MRKYVRNSKTKYIVLRLRRIYLILHFQITKLKLLNSS